MNLTGQGKVQSYAVAIDADAAPDASDSFASVLLLIFLVLISARTLMQKLEMVVGSEVQQEIQAYLRERLHRAIVGADWLFLCRKKSSDLVHVLTREVERIGIATISHAVACGRCSGNCDLHCGSGDAFDRSDVDGSRRGALARDRPAREDPGASRQSGARCRAPTSSSTAPSSRMCRSLKATKAYSAESHDREAFARFEFCGFGSAQ